MLRIFEIKHRFMKALFFFLFGIFITGHSVAQRVASDSILKMVSIKLNSLHNIRYHSLRELDYATENYHNKSEWDVYLAFENKNSVPGFIYQVSDTKSKQFYNGTEAFNLDLLAKTISVNDQPVPSDFSSLSYFYNSMVTLKNALPGIIADESVIKSLTDTLLNGRPGYNIRINMGKRRLQNLGLGLDSMKTKYDFIYHIIIDKVTTLPVLILQVNNFNTDFIKTVFTELEIEKTDPIDASWYYSTYLNVYKPEIKRVDKHLLLLGSAAPEWELKNLSSNKLVSLKNLRGQVILLDFWIKNCGPCIKSVPELNDLQNKFKNRKFKIVSINSYDASKDVKWFCEKFGVDYTVLTNGRNVAERYGVAGFPSFFILDKTGKIIYTGSGFEKSMKGELIRIIETAL